MEEDETMAATWVRWGDIPLEARRGIARDPESVLATNPPRWRNRDKGYLDRELLVKDEAVKSWA